MRSLFFIPLFFIGCVSQGRILYSYYFSSVERCIDSTFSSVCVVSPARLDEKNDMPVIRGTKPKGVADFVYTFGLTNQVGPTEIESVLNKNCQEIGKKGIYYELFITKRFGIVTSGELQGWCE